MLRILSVLFVTLSILKPVASVQAADCAPTSVTSRMELAPTDWPWWRGPNRDGIAARGQEPPLRWSETENVIWKTPVPGRGHGSATVVGNQVFLATADEQKEVQSVLCFDRQTGKQLWKTDIHTGGFSKKGENQKGSQASITVACDGERLFVNFQNSGAIHATALNRDGKQLWQKKISDFVSHQGFGASPAIYQSLVIFSADNKGGGAIAALDRVTGDTVWRHERPKVPNYTSPVILKAAGKEQLVFTGCDLVSSFEPLTGKKLWEVSGATTECVTSTVTDGSIVITSGGYPNHLSAVRADGSGKVAWENSTRVYVPSLLIRDGLLHAMTDDGVAMCWQTDSGKPLWKSRLGGTFSASPVLVGDTVFAVNEGGKAFVYKPGRESMELIAENQLGNEVFATPTICGGRIYLRVASQQDGQRREFLYCLGNGK